MTPCLFAVLLVLLIASLVVNGLGIFFSHHDVTANLDEDDRPFIQKARTRGVVLLGAGLALNTLAGFVSLIYASAPAA